MNKAVLDTNVVVSALLDPERPAALILDLAASRAFRCYASESLLEEYAEVLRRARLGLDARNTARFIRTLRRFVIVVVPQRKIEVASDPDDNKILECALEARADYVVTGNIRDFPPHFQDIRLVSPRQFLTILASEPH